MGWVEGIGSWLRGKGRCAGKGADIIDGHE